MAEAPRHALPHRLSVGGLPDHERRHRGEVVGVGRVLQPEQEPDQQHGEQRHHTPGAVRATALLSHR